MKTPKIATPITLRLDRSKKYSEVRGERQPDDPHYGVHFIQDGLPFNAGGDLIADNGKSGPYKGLNLDGKEIIHQPLYDDAMRAKVKLKLERQAKLARGARLAEEPVVDELSEEEEKEAAAAEINFESWLRGEVEYEPFMLYAAAKTRFGSRYTKLCDLIEDLVEDHKLIPIEMLASSRARVLDQRAAA